MLSLFYSTLTTALKQYLITFQPFQGTINIRRSMEIILVPKVLFSMFCSLMYFQQCAAGVCTSSITVIVTQQSARRGNLFLSSPAPSLLNIYFRIYGVRVLLSTCVMFMTRRLGGQNPKDLALFPKPSSLERPQ